MFAPLAKLGRVSWAVGAVGIAIGCASGGAIDETELLPEEPAPEEPAPEEPAEPLEPRKTMEASLGEWQGALAGSLSEDERRTILSLLTAQGIPEEQLTFRGRMVVRGGDAQWFADDILGAGDSEGLVEKGLVISQPNFNNIGNQLCYEPGAPYQTACPLNPDDLANASGGNLLWKRPQVSPYFIIAAPGMPAHFTGANGILTKAAELIANGVASGSGDCLNSPNGLFSVQTNASYQAQPFWAKDAYHNIWVHPAENICPGGGCAAFPRGDTFGPGMALPTSLPNTPYGVGVAVHELLHTMGFAHSDEAIVATLKIPGTPNVCAPFSPFSNPPNECAPDSVGLSNGSIMHSGLNDPGWDDWIDNATGATKIPPGDVNMIKKLYGTETGCAFQSGFRTVTPCGPNGILNGNVCCLGPCASCGGPGCSGAPGNTDRCCTGRIQNTDKPCGPNAAPCVVR